jgi:putative transposase
MPRIARLVVPDYPHHITQRGNYRQIVFNDDADRRQYLELISLYSKKFHLTILSYCLMSNHVHFIAVPKNEDSLASTFRIAHTRYSQYFNKKIQTYGHLWQGRFYSCVLDDRRLIATARYVERNPVRIKIVKNPTDYNWSSARNHVGASHNDIIDTSTLFKHIDFKQKEWEKFIGESDEPDEVTVIRKYTMTGRPLGGTSFIRKLEKAFDKKLHALPVGRPKRAINKK